MADISLRIVLCDQDEPIVSAWEQEFAGCRGVDIRHGDSFEVQADAYVSPANSFGIMDGRDNKCWIYGVASHAPAVER